MKKTFRPRNRDLKKFQEERTGRFRQRIVPSKKRTKLRMEDLEDEAFEADHLMDDWYFQKEKEEKKDRDDGA